METLGYGSHIIINGYSAKNDTLMDETKVKTLLERIAESLEPGKDIDVEIYQVETPLGLSACSLQSESHLSLHTFSNPNLLMLKIFSRHSLDTQALTGLLQETFDIHRFESRLSNHSKTMAKDEATRKRTLLGDRQYAALHLRKNIAF